MKLNLLPTYVSKEKVTRSALLLSILLFVVCILGAIGLYAKAQGDLEASKTDIAELRGKAQRAVDTSAEADKVMQQSTTLLRNTALAEAMLKHNSAYPDLYDGIKRYIPSFYRINSMSAQATGPGVSTITLVGVLDTYQQYADLMLALLRIPNVQAVSRTGFTNNMTYVPAPTEIDQYGKPRKPGEAPIPDDPIQRLEYFQSRGRITGFTGTGGFGSGQPGLRGATPTESTVTVTIVIAQDLQTPDPRATLSMNGGATTGNSGGPGATGGNLPNTPPATTTTPSTTPSSGSTPGGGRRRGSSQEDE